MTYYIRVFGVEAGAPKISELNDWAEDALGSIESEFDDTDKLWPEVSVLDDRNEVVAVLTRDLVDLSNQDSVGADDINNFVQSLNDVSPRSAAEWLQRYLSRCTVVYCFQILSAIEETNGWNVVRELITALRDYSGGISHTEGEGFSNEEGYQITWEFPEKVGGDCQMAVRNGGQWLKFRMDLSSRTQRTAFLEGKCPEGALVIDE